MKPAKIVLITGASSGIGKAIAKELSIHGYEVILTARNKEKLVTLFSSLIRNSIQAMDTRVQ